MGLLLHWLTTAAASPRLSHLPDADGVWTGSMPAVTRAQALVELVAGLIYIRSAAQNEMTGPAGHSGALFELTAVAAATP